MDRKEELKKLIQEAQEAYYNLEPKVSDQVYDAWVDELTQLDPIATEVTVVGAPVPQLSVWEKVAHEIPMGSLNKVNSFEEFKEWAQKTGASTLFMTHKVDGSSMELVYKSGKLIRCVTRGDGIIGEDVTANVIQIPSVPKQLEEPVDVTVRGEIVMFKSVFEKKYAGVYANPRNTAAAKVREKKGGGETCRDLEFIAYWMQLGDNAFQPKTVVFMIDWLERRKFNIPECSVTIITEMDHMYRLYESTKKNRDSIPYEIDGMVVSVNNLDRFEELGELNMRPRGQIAWKFDSAMGISRVIDIKWQVGLTGRITPVASIEPVNIGGVTITSVSLHNLTLFRDLRLSPGSQVLVSRRNDVIPYIEARLDDNKADELKQ